MLRALKKSEFKLIPEKIEDITVDWCNEIFQRGKCISSDVVVESVEVSRLTSNNDSEMTDGDGLSGAMMLKLKLSYRYINMQYLL